MKRPRVVHWLRRHPLASDGLLALAVTFFALGALWGGSKQTPEARDPDALGTVLAIVTCLPLVVRRLHPIAVLAIVAPAQFSMEVFNFEGPGWVSVLIALYTVAAHTNGSPRTITARVFGTCVVVFLFSGLVTGNARVAEAISSVVFLVAAFILGDNLQRRRRAHAELAERTERAEREHELMSRQKVQDERSRIARELHDVVAHSVSLMIIQAGAARRSISASPLQAEAALRDLETTGRHAMDELRRVLGVMRTGDSAEGLELEPQPSLATVRSLLESDAGLPVELREIGTPPADLPSSVGLSLYRVVQEALTNVRKHAGQVKHVAVEVAYEPELVTVQITDDGRGASVANNIHGHGLVGMRERMALCGGTVSAGPRPGGGWQVVATAPLEEALA